MHLHSEASKLVLQGGDWIWSRRHDYGVTYNVQEKLSSIRPGVHNLSQRCVIPASRATDMMAVHFSVEGTMWILIYGAMHDVVEKFSSVGLQYKLHTSVIPTTTGLQLGVT